MRKIGLLAIILASMVSCLKESQLKKPFITLQPFQIYDGWELSNPQSESIDSAGLTEIYKSFHEDDELWQVRSLLVFRNAKLVAESYTKDETDLTRPRAIWSATKQVVGILTGIALEQQLIQSLTDSIYHYLPETAQHPDKIGITVEHLLTMRSGIKYSNDGLSGQTDDILRQLPDNITAFILSLPMSATPGELVAYKDGDPQLVASIIQSQCGKTTYQWAKEVLFDPLEIQHLDWVSYKDGTTLGGFGIMTTPREMAKFGQCVMDGGQWKGVQLVSNDWIDEMTSVKIQDIYGYQFGYLWWKDESRGLIFMSGHGGQYVFLMPAKNLMIVMTAEVNTQGDFQFNRDKALKWVDEIIEIAF
ncbi:MAG: serine hydrolase [Sphingobacteriales bacterium]|nr:MAG: serine hydrolase [Sphingobacteriales bacterium]